MNLEEVQKLDLPTEPGCYFFRKGKDILYIGKATSLRDRVKSYFAKDLIKTRGPGIIDMVWKSDSLTWETTDTVLEALLLEAELIKRYQPHYNVKEKDNKSFLCVGVTKEDFPQVLTIRKKDIDFAKKTAVIERGKRTVLLQAIYGPFVSGGSLKEAMGIIRRIFPYRDASSSKRDNYQFYRQLGLTPTVIEAGNRSEDGVYDTVKAEYAKTIKNITLFFQGKKKEIIRNLERDMKAYAKAQAFEKAGDVKRQLFALTHINDTALLKRDVSDHSFMAGRVFRIEAYDVAHLSGKQMVGVMTVVENGTVAKNEYKKFIIRSQTGSNDAGALEEILSRRFRHSEWGIPDLVVVDGNDVQRRVAERVLSRYQLAIPVVSVVKDDRHKAREILGASKDKEGRETAIILANAESHRFAITFHKQKRAKAFLG